MQHLQAFMAKKIFAHLYKYRLARKDSNFWYLTKIETRFSAQIAPN